MAKILVVDDSPELLELFSEILTNNGHTVQIADSKKNLQNQLPVFAPDLILLDVNLNGEDGREICKEIKQQSLFKHIPIILTSASPELLQDYEVFKADGVIEKPFGLTQILQKISEVLKK